MRLNHTRRDMVKFTDNTLHKGTDQRGLLGCGMLIAVWLLALLTAVAAAATRWLWSH